MEQEEDLTVLHDVTGHHEVLWKFGTAQGMARRPLSGGALLRFRRRDHPPDGTRVLSSSLLLRPQSHSRGARGEAFKKRGAYGFPWLDTRHLPRRHRRARPLRTELPCPLL